MISNNYYCKEKVWRYQSGNPKPYNLWRTDNAMAKKTKNGQQSLHRKLRTKETWILLKPGMDSGDAWGYAVLAPLVVSILFFKYYTASLINFHIKLTLIHVNVSLAVQVSCIKVHDSSFVVGAARSNSPTLLTLWSWDFRVLSYSKTTNMNTVSNIKCSDWTVGKEKL
jgi:hypothetical protein